MSTMFIKVPSTGAAWDAARDLLRPVVSGLGLDVFPGFVKDDASSARAGYSVYRLAGWDDLAAENDPANMQDSEKLYYNYVSDLGGVLELNTCSADWSGDVYRISIVPASAFAAAAAAPAAVADGDGLQEAATSSPVQSSAAAGASPAGSSESAPAAADSVQGSEIGAADPGADAPAVLAATDPRPACWVISDGLEGDERVQVDMVSRKDGFIRSFDTLAGFLREWSWFYSCGVGVMDDDKLAAALQYVTEAGHGARASVLDAGFEIVFTFYRWAGYDRFMNRVASGEVA